MIQRHVLIATINNPKTTKGLGFTKEKPIPKKPILNPTPTSTPKPVNQDNNVNDKVNEFTNYISEALDELAPVKTFVTHS